MHPLIQARGSVSIMMKAVLLAAVAIVRAETDAQRAARIQAVIGAGKVAKFTWHTANFDGFVSGLASGDANSSIKYMSSATGTIDTIKRGAGPCLVPTFTWDGAKIVYTIHHRSGTTPDEVRMMDLTGANDVLIAKNYFAWSCWRDAAAGVNYAIATNMGTGKVTKISLADTSKKTALYTPAVSDWSFAGEGWVGLSTDGKYMGGGFPYTTALKIADLTTSTARSVVDNGCWSTMARDNTGDMLNQTFSSNNFCGQSVGEHEGWVIAKFDGTRKSCIIPMSFTPPAISAPYCFTRWSNDRNFLTYSNSDGGGDNNGVGQENPRILNISAKKFCGIYLDNTPYPVDSYVDMYITDGTSVSEPLPFAAVRWLTAQRAGARFDLRGRALAAGGRTNAGVCLVATAGHVTRAVSCDLTK